MSKRHYYKHKKLAKSILVARVIHFAQLYGVKIKRIAIRNQKTIWGSCSDLGNLNFNYKVAFLPAEMRDYVIVHEICHLLEFNHSSRFWELLSREIPEYASIKRLFRKVQL